MSKLGHETYVRTCEAVFERTWSWRSNLNVMNKFRPGLVSAGFNSDDQQIYEESRRDSVWCYSIS